MTPPQTLLLLPVAPEDIPILSQVWFAAFTDPGLRRLWPDTPGVRGWWDAGNAHDFAHKPFQRYIKVVDPSALDAAGRPRLVAYAKWDLAMPGEVCDDFFKREEAERRRVMGGVKHYYLDTLATHPDYQGRGAGSMLVKWGCDLADEHGVAAYVDASKAGAKLYQKFGFVDESEPDAGDIASMARRRP